MSELIDDGAQVERKVIEVLDGLGVPYEIIAIDPAFADTAQFCEQYGFRWTNPATRSSSARRRSRSSTRHASCWRRRRLDVNHTVRKLMGVPRLSFATAEETRALTGMMIGGVTVFALPPDLPIYVDETRIECERIILGGGSRSTKVLVAPEVLKRLPNARVIDGLSAAAG